MAAAAENGEGGAEEDGQDGAKGAQDGAQNTQGTQDGGMIAGHLDPKDLESLKKADLERIDAMMDSLHDKLAEMEEESPFITKPAPAGTEE